MDYKTNIMEKFEENIKENIRTLMSLIWKMNDMIKILNDHLKKVGVFLLFLICFEIEKLQYLFQRLRLEVI